MSLKIVWFIKYLNKLWFVALGNNNEHWSDLLRYRIVLCKFTLLVSRILNIIDRFYLSETASNCGRFFRYNVSCRGGPKRYSIFPLHQPWQILIIFFLIDKHIHLVGTGPLVQMRSWWVGISSFHVIYPEKVVTMLLASTKIVTPPLKTMDAILLQL